jgi:hypothetical protein
VVGLHDEGGHQRPSHVIRGHPTYRGAEERHVVGLHEDVK